MGILPKKDVVIVGFGAAGGPAAVELARAGYQVVALERGRHRRTETDFVNSLDTLRYAVRGDLLPSFDEVPLTFRTHESEVARPVNYIMANTVGGASVHWSGQSWRFYVDDFRVKSSIDEMYGKDGLLDYLREDGAALADWPVSYDEFEPYYDRVEYYVGVGGWPGNIQGTIRPVDPGEGNPFEAPRQRDYPFRPLRDNATDLTFREGALRLGLNAFHVPTAITTDTYTSPYGVTRPGCTYCTFCTSHGCWNGSKSSSLVSLLPAAEATGNFELRPNCHVLKINHKGSRAISVEYIDEHGNHQVQPGDIFLLAAYTFQNVRLLLHSGLTGGGLVGKYFMNRSGPSVSAIFEDRYLNGYNGPAVQRQGIDDFNGENAAEEKLSLGRENFFIRGAFIGSPSQRNPLETYNAVIAPGVPRWGQEYKEHLRQNLNRFISLQLLQEPLPYESSYIDLDPNYTDKYGVPAARVHRQAKKNEVRMSRFIYQKATEILKAAGASQVWGRETPTATATMTHDTGGCRMGADPSRSVVNRYCQMWEVPNLFVGGGAVFPSMSGHNPTETIWMLSFWTADAIIKNKVNLYDSHDLR